MNRVHPSAVCRQILTNLDSHKGLTESEQTAILHAIEDTGIVVERVLADLSRQTINVVLSEM